MENSIIAGTSIHYNHSTGVLATDRVIRVESDNYIITVPTIGRAWKEVTIHISQIVSYTNHVKLQTNC